MKIASLVRGAALLGAALGCATSAKAATFIAQVWAGPDSDSASSTGALITAAASNQFLDLPTGSYAASGNAQVEAGAVRASSFASATATGGGCCTAYSTIGTAYAEYSDSFVLSGPGLGFGQIAQANVLLDLTGILGGTGVGEGWGISGDYRVAIYVNNEQFLYSGAYLANANGVFDGSNPLGRFVVPVNLFVGVVNSVTMRLETRADAFVSLGVYGTGAIDSNFFNTLTWSGLDGLAVNGNAVTNFNAVSSDTGFDFRAGYTAAPGAVPEPGTWAMMIAGFGLLGAGMRHRHSPVIPGRLSRSRSRRSVAA